ncbi:hypothetical protein ABZX92_44045 [Lentzea sp. NPDC006480]|uniref:hypothetical protein n=1 Tax=Lentzea sp. NPDC006480 TaxID=3157176 RepID=UPI0033B12E9D
MHGDIVVGPGSEYLDIEVSCDPAGIEVMPNEVDFIGHWIASERARLHAVADEYDWSRNQRPSDFLEHRHMVSQRALRDLRSREVYESHVEDYLVQSSEVLAERFLLLLEDDERTSVQLVVVNPTDLHFRDVELRLWFEGPVRGLADDLRYTLPSRWPELPPVPAAPGTLSEDVFKHQLVMSPPKRIRERTRAERAANGEDVLNGWSGRDLSRGIVVTFEKFSLRPREELLLPAVPLKVLVSPGGSLSGRWDATADPSRGRCEGELDLAVWPSSVNLVEVAEPGPPSQNNASVLDALGAVAWAIIGHPRPQAGSVPPPLDDLHR